MSIKYTLTYVTTPNTFETSQEFIDFLSAIPACAASMAVTNNYVSQNLITFRSLTTTPTGAVSVKVFANSDIFVQFNQDPVHLNLVDTWSSLGWQTSSVTEQID